MKKILSLLLLLCFGMVSAYAAPHHDAAKSNKHHIQSSKHHLSKIHARHKKNLSGHKTKKIKRLTTLFLAEKKYDHIFKHWQSKYPSSVSSHTLKALCITESRLKEKATSNHGARGICQLKTSTYLDTNKAGHKVPSNGIYTATHNIHAAAYYLKVLDKYWDNEHISAKQKLTIASYNAGIGNILKAKKLCHNAQSYDKIMACLPKVTGIKNTNITKKYVAGIMELSNKT